MGAFSIRETYAGKHVLITGASGFVGKVWLAMALTRVPDIGRIYVLIRGKGRGAKERFERIVSESMVFRPLHEKHGPELGRWVSERVEVVSGDLGLPGLGIAPEVAERLHGDLDLVVNCAGLVEFNPDLRDAMSSNVDGALHVGDFVERCDHAALLHVSTCYVAGQRDGFIPEALSEGTTPNGTPIDPEAEYAKALQIMEEVTRENDSTATEQQLRKDVVARVRERGVEPEEKRVTEMVGRLKRKRLREMMATAGTDRSKQLGWPNTYTYTKALAELLLKQRERAGKFKLALFRPAIVESSLEFPFAGWNEGFNTSGPLVYLAGTWFRHIPAKAGNPLDVIPVDFICNGLFTVGAALIRGEHAPVYQVGTSQRNTLEIDRLTELSALAHRKHLRKIGTNKIDKLVLSRWDARATDPDHVLNVANIREAVLQVRRYLRNGLPEKLPIEVKERAEDLAEAADTAQRKLRQIDEVLDLFIPFTYDHYLVFESQALARHEVVEPEFRFDPERIEWRTYWLDVHVPGLRRWCFPKYENKDLEKYVPKTPFKLIDVAAEPRASEPGATQTASSM